MKAKKNWAASALLVGALGAASCVGPRVVPSPHSGQPMPQASAPAPRPAPVRASAYPPAASWIDNPATPGDWRWNMEGGQSVARFAEGRLLLRCDPAARAVRVERSEPGAKIATTAAIRLLTPTLVRSFNAIAQGGAYSVSLGARDPLLDALAFAKGRFAVEVTGLPTLYVPSWTEVSRVVEDCR